MKKGLTDSGWDVMCNVSQVVVDVEGRMGHLYLPKLNVPDMKSTINCFTSVDSECSRIQTYVDRVRDVIYVKDADGWRVEYPDPAADNDEAFEYEDIVKAVVAKHPTLTAFGFGGEGDIRPFAVRHCTEWLLQHDALERRKTINSKISSYSWKHTVERACGEYISNGEFICAALYLGYRMKTKGPNAWFNIRDVEKQ